MLSHNQINILSEFSRIYPEFEKGLAWCLDKNRNILYSPVSESKLKEILDSLPTYKDYIVITGKTIQRLKVHV